MVKAAVTFADPIPYPISRRVYLLAFEVLGFVLAQIVVIGLAFGDL
jgi:hypothetical protein